MMDLLTLAFQTDSTRVATLLLGIEQSPRSYGAEIGISDAHHGLTHHSGDPEKIEKVTKINCYHIEQFTYLLDKLKAVKEGDGTLLDHSLVMYGTNMGDSNQHLHYDVPHVLVGGASGQLKGGRHLAYKTKTVTTGNLLLVDSVTGASAANHTPSAQSSNDERPIRRSDARVEMLARGIAIPDVNADQEPSTRFFRDMMIVGHLAFSLGRLSLAPQVASKIARGWQFVLDHQRFRLRNPRNGVPAIEAAIATTGTDAVGAIAELLLAAADSVEHPLGDGWIEMLKTLRKTKRSARPS
jgi:hypothetical protein